MFQTKYYHHGTAHQKGYCDFGISMSVYVYVYAVACRERVGLGDEEHEGSIGSFSWKQEKLAFLMKAINRITRCGLVVVAYCSFYHVV